MNHMGMVGDAERLPWLKDDRPTRNGGGPALIILSLLATLLIAAAAYWLGMQTAPVAQPAGVAPSTTIDLPEPLVGPPEEIRTEPTLEDAQPQPMVVPEAAPQRAAPPVERPASANTNRQEAPEKKVAAKPAAPKKTVLKFWPVRQVDGASGRMVRIGTFATARQAKRGWWKVVGTYPGMTRIQTMVVPVRSLRNGETYYRLQMGTTSHAHSEVLCQRMRVVGQSCVVIGLPPAKTSA